MPDTQTETPIGAPAAEVTVRLTPKAVQMAKSMLARDGLAGAALRIGVAGGGCSGLQYTLGFEQLRRQDDVVFEIDGLCVYVDADSLRHLAGVTVDYVDALHGAGFKFSNPNASRTCGCGTSFAV